MGPDFKNSPHEFEIDRMSEFVRIARSMGQFQVDQLAALYMLLVDDELLAQADLGATLLREERASEMAHELSDASRMARTVRSQINTVMPGLLDVDSDPFTLQAQQLLRHAHYDRINAAFVVGFVKGLRKETFEQIRQLVQSLCN